MLALQYYSKILVLQLSRTLRRQQSGINLRLFWTTTESLLSLFVYFLFLLFISSVLHAAKDVLGCNKSTKETRVKIMVQHATVRMLNYYESKIILLL